MFPHLAEMLTEVDMTALVCALPAAVDVIRIFRRNTGFAGPDVRSQQYAREKLCETCRMPLRSRSFTNRHQRCLESSAFAIRDDVSFFRRLEIVRNLSKMALKMPCQNKLVVTRLSAAIRKNVLHKLSMLIDRGDWRRAAEEVRVLVKVGEDRLKDMQKYARDFLEGRAIRPVGVSYFLKMYCPDALNGLYLGGSYHPIIWRGFNRMTRKYFPGVVVQRWRESVEGDRGETIQACNRRLAFVSRFSRFLETSLLQKMVKTKKFIGLKHMRGFLKTLESFEYRFSAASNLDAYCITKLLSALTVQDDFKYALELMECNIPRVVGDIMDETSRNVIEVAEQLICKTKT